MVMAVVPMGGGGCSECRTSLNFNVKVYRFELPQATTIESSASASCGALGRKGYFL